MKRFYFALLLGMVAFPLSSRASALIGELSSQEDISETRKVARGVEHRYQFDSAKPLMVNTLIVDLSVAGLSVEAEKGNDLLFSGEKLAAMAQRESHEGHRVVGAVNGDFWETGFTPSGFLVDEGTIYAEASRRAVFVMTRDRTPYITTTTLELTLQSPEGKKLEIDGINESEVGADKVIVFTAPYGKPIPAKKGDFCLLFKLEGGEFVPNKPAKAEVVRA
ncbi:MAG: hypothetical protein V2A74_06905, partial [bacterium]